MRSDPQAPPGTTLSRLARFRLSPAEDAQITALFRIVLRECAFQRIGETALAVTSHKDVSGVYLWLLRVGDQKFKIYAGKTKSLSNRIKNYLSEFQPHSPNDFKLRVFHDFVVESFEGAIFELYFQELAVGRSTRPSPAEQLTELENRILKDLAPLLLNERATQSMESRNGLRDAFAAFYRSGFESLLGGPDSLRDDI